MIVILTDTWTSGQGTTLIAGDKIDCNRDTYLKLLKDGKCEALPGDKKNKKKSKKIKSNGDISSTTDN
jgi:uncharacterized membrane protein